MVDRDFLRREHERVLSALRDVRCKVGDVDHVVWAGLGPGYVSIRCVAYLKCVKTGHRDYQQGREWLILPHMDAAAIQRTAFLAIKQFVLHELAESFMVGGVRIFDPHKEHRAYPTR